MTVTEAIKLLSRYAPCLHENTISTGFECQRTLCIDCGRYVDHDAQKKSRDAAAQFEDAIEVISAHIGVKQFKNGEPCKHPGCLNHVTHPCEGCGRTAGRSAKETFEKKLRALINSHSLENESNTSDFILAGYLLDCLDATQKRDMFVGRMLTAKASPKR